MKKVKEGYKISSKGVIPEDWKVVSFKQCINISNGQVDPKEEPYCNMKHIGPGNIEKFTGKLLYVNTAKEDMQTSGKYLFNNKDVLYGKINPQLGKVAYPQYEGICSADMYPMRANEAYIKPLFLKYLLLSNDFFKYSVSVSMRTGMPKINREELNLYDLLLPTIEEQDKIASILSIVDEQIDNVDELIEKNKELKKGLMQQLLTKGIGHTKFKKTEIGEIPEEWEVKKSSEVFNIITDYVANGSFASLAEKVKYKESEDYAILVRLTDYKNNYKGPFIYVDKEAYDFLNKSRLEKNDIIIANVGAYAGYTFKAPNIEKPITLGPNAILVRSIQNREFIYYWLSSDIGQKALKEIISTTAQPKFNKTDFKKIQLPIPNLEEQEKIALILSEVDKKIEEYENKKQKLEELKRGLMQQLLTGKIRII